MRAERVRSEDGATDGKVRGERLRAKRRCAAIELSLFEVEGTVKKRVVLCSCYPFLVRVKRRGKRGERRGTC